MQELLEIDKHKLLIRHAYYKLCDATIYLDGLNVSAIDKRELHKASRAVARAMELLDSASKM